MDRHNLVGIANLLIGKTMEEAIKIYPIVREAIVDGNRLPLEDDLRSNRINVEMKNGIIIEILGVY